MIMMMMTTTTTTTTTMIKGIRKNLKIKTTTGATPGATTESLRNLRRKREKGRK